MITEFMQELFLQDERVHDSHRLIWLAYRAHQLSPCQEPELTNAYIQTLTGLSQTTISRARRQLQEWGYEIPPQVMPYSVIPMTTPLVAMTTPLVATSTHPKMEDPKRKDPAKPKAQTRTSFESSGFSLDEVARSYFCQHIPNRDPEAEFEFFADYHRSKGSLFSDWHAAWRNWTRNALKYAKPSYQNGLGDTQSTYEGIEI